MKLKLKSFFYSHKPTVLKIIRRANSGTSFNDLNNDLLYELFDYLTYDEILQSFGHLNSYFNELIRNYPHSVDFQIHKPYPNHIRSLKLSTSNHLLAFNALQSSQLTSLRAITLGNLRPQDVLNVLNAIPSQQIEYIYLGICAVDRICGTTEMLSKIQNQTLSLGQYRLKQCYLKEKYSVTIDDLPERSVSLECLQIVACHDLFLVSQLLLRTPNLKHLNVSTTNIHQYPLLSNTSHLTSLSIRPHLDCSVDELRIFLRECCSNLKKLIVKLYTYRGKKPCLLVNKHQWLTVFPSRLEYFHLKSLASSSVHLFYTIKDPNERQSPLKEKLLLRFSDIEKQYCQILIDPPLVSAWIKDD